MSKRNKDTDYLHISARLRVLEGSLLTRERRERMLEARTDEDAVKVLSECGVEGLEPLNSQTLENALARRRDEAFEALRKLSPNERLVDFFLIKYDYHNAKALVKCAATGQDPSPMLSEAGRYPAAALLDAFRQDALEGLSPALSQDVAQARDVLSSTGDPQRSDFVLDRACFRELRLTARESGSAFLQEYVRQMIDAANLKAAVRTVRMGKDPAFWQAVCLEGGSVELAAVTAAVQAGTGLETAFPGPLREAAALGDEILKGGRQTAFERACDNALAEYLRQSRSVPFGDSVLISYLAALENDLTAARIILSGRMAGVPAESIRERLREAYV